MTSDGGQLPREPAPGVALFAWVKQELLDSIARGEFSADEPFVTQREVVERFGVSTTTAIRALNELVAEGVVVRRRGRGTFVAERVPGPRVVPPGKPVLAYVSPDRRAGMHDAELLAGLSAETAALGYQVTVAHTRGTAHEEEVLRTVAAGAQGVVLFALDRSTAAGVVDELRRVGVVVVLVDRYLPGLPTDAVLFDDFAVGYEVTAAMIDRGHKSMALLWSETDVTSVRDRLAGHRRALRDRGLPELPERSALRPFAHLEAPARQHRLRALLEGSGDPLTALLFGNAPTLALAASDLLAMDVDFPRSVELASMDQSIPDAVSPLAVVSARLPTREMGRRAARLAHERIEGSTEPAGHVVLPAEVQVAAPGRNRLVVSGADAVRAAPPR